MIHIDTNAYTVVNHTMLINAGKEEKCQFNIAVKNIYY